LAANAGAADVALGLPVIKKCAQFAKFPTHFWPKECEWVGRKKNIARVVYIRNAIGQKLRRHNNLKNRHQRAMDKLLTICCLSIAFVAAGAVAGDTSLQVATLDAGTAPAPTEERDIWNELDPSHLKLRSAAALIVDAEGNVVYAKDIDEPKPIASITKLITAMVVLDSGLPLDEPITITKEDRDLIKLTGSRLVYGSTLSREKMLRVALLASDNRAANTLARNYPGGRSAFVQTMNAKAEALGMSASHFVDPAGLDPANVASARDAVKMVRAARSYPLIVEATTSTSMTVYPLKGRGPLRFGNTNRLLRRASWDISLSKTGYINEAGRCLVMQAELVEHPMVIVLLDSFGKLTPYGDSNRLRRWLESELHS
jgi:D-alanyl-D-alanine endopeptidase (penicillin-binding protein 7)